METQQINDLVGTYNDILTAWLNDKEIFLDL